MTDDTTRLLRIARLERDNEALGIAERHLADYAALLKTILGVGSESSEPAGALIDGTHQGFKPATPTHEDTES